jgi:hypothetical protein
MTLSKLDSFSIEEKLNFSKVNYDPAEFTDVSFPASTTASKSNCSKSDLKEDAPEFIPF